MLITGRKYQSIKTDMKAPIEGNKVFLFHPSSYQSRETKICDKIVLIFISHVVTILWMVAELCKVYNQLPQSIKILANDENSFKFALKRFLYNHSFYSMNEYFQYKEDKGL
jgi:hypothetical protein